MNIKSVYGNVLSVITCLAGIDNAKKFDTYLRFHRRLDLKNPKTLADKVSYLELHAQSELAAMYTDKYEVRNYVIQKGHGDILVPMVGGPWCSYREIDFESLPSSFALKATHGCKMNYMVLDKDSMDKEKCESEVEKWLSTTYGTYSVEPHYAKIPHRIYAEKYLGNIAQLTDYKFHCFDGVPKFIMVVTNRHSGGKKGNKSTLDLFDIDWKPIPEVVDFSCIPGNGMVQKPVCFDKMLQIAKDLSKDFKFVRVDLYEVDNHVMFGELTFTPSCCVFPNFSEKFVKEMGEELAL